MNTRSRSLAVGLTVTGVAASLAIAGPAVAGTPHAPHTVYVGTALSKWGPGSSCSRPGSTSIQTAIDSVAVGGKVVVCKGTYPGMINVDQRITLSGRPGATIDATGDVYGVGVSASWSTVEGLKVVNASPYDPDNNQIADGILTAAFGASGPVAADHVRIVHNVVSGNLGSGIDINSSSYSTASDNYAHDNGVGINVADDLGVPASHNTITHNVTNRNFGGCGIALADHSGAGVNDNWVAHNISDNNGLLTASAPDASSGSGVILASPIPGGVVKGNTILGNSFWGNGHAGVVVHSHAPGSDFSGNLIVGNSIGRNNVRTDENDLETTGIYIGSYGPLTITIVGNRIGPDHYGIFASGPVTLKHSGNHYVGVAHEVGTFPTF